MLKGRSKKFAPKKVVRPAGNASARPSVSQTPEPSQASPQDAPQISQQATVADDSQALATPAVHTSSERDASQELPDAVAAVSQGGNTLRPELKRKDREDDFPPPPAKRVPVPAEEPAEPVPQVERPVEAPIQHEQVPAVHESAESLVEPTQKAFPRPKALPSEEAPAAGPAEPSAYQASAESQDESSTETGVATVATIPSEPASIAPASSLPVPNTVVSSLLAAPEETPVRTSTRPAVEPTGSVSSDVSSAPPAPRYPSPVNIARLPEEVQYGSLNMGRAGAGAPASGSAGDNVTALRPGEVNESSEIVPTGVLNPDGTSGSVEAGKTAASAAGEGVSHPKKKYTKRKKVQQPEDGNDARTTVDIRLNKPRRVAGPKKPCKKRTDVTAARGRKKRADTPEGASDEEIDQSTLTMTDLCKDLRIGKKFSRHQEIKERVKARYEHNVREKMKRNNPEVAALVDAAPRQGVVEEEASTSAPVAPASEAAGDAEAEAEEEAPVIPGSGIQMRLVNNQLVVDDTSTQIDRHARGRVDEQTMQHVVENDFTKVITSGTYMKRERAQLWDHAATSRFYEGLAQFGTDFEMIAKLFPHRSRRQIKLKFNKEERVNAEKINRTLIGPKKKHIDLKNFEKMADLKLEEIADIERERDEYEQLQIEKEKEDNEREAEINRQKKAAIRGQDAQARDLLATVGEEEDDAGENRGRGPPKSALKRGGKKNKHSAYAGGEEFTVLGTIER